MGGMTTNDIELNERLVDSVIQQRKVSDLVRAGRLDAAVVAHAMWEDNIRKLGWRILDLTRKETK